MGLDAEFWKLFFILCGASGLIGYGLYQLLGLLHGDKYFVYDETNPFRRTCKSCGSLQNQFRTNYVGHNSWWWEIMMNGREDNDKNCKCKKYAR